MTLTKEKGEMHPKLLDNTLSFITEVTQVAEVWRCPLSGDHFVTIDGGDYHVSEMAGVSAKFRAVKGQNHAEIDEKYEKGRRCLLTVEKARTQYASDTIEFDDNAEVGTEGYRPYRKDWGVYVQCRVWVALEKPEPKRSND